MVFLSTKKKLGPIWGLGGVASLVCIGRDFNLFKFPLPLERRNCVRILMAKGCLLDFMEELSLVDPLSLVVFRLGVMG